MRLSCNLFAPLRDTAATPFAWTAEPSRRRSARWRRRRGSCASTAPCVVRRRRSVEPAMGESAWRTAVESGHGEMERGSWCIFQNAAYRFVICSLELCSFFWGVASRQDLFDNRILIYSYNIIVIQGRCDAFETDLDMIGVVPVCGGRLPCARRVFKGSDCCGSM